MKARGWVRLFAILLLLAGLSATAQAQFGNSVSGFVFGVDRRPIADANVELNDEYSRMIGRARTNASGRYSFSRMSSGRFRIRVFAVGDYEDQEQEIEIQNVSTSDSSGNVRISGYDNVQRDFYLRPRKANGAQGKAGVVFAQAVPEAARAKYNSAVNSLSSGRNNEALADLKSAIELFPDYFEALERLAAEYIKLQHYLPAELLYLKALQVNPRSFNSWYGVAYAYNSLGNTKEALEAADKALELNQRSSEATLLKGILHRKLKQFPEAEATLKKANELTGGNVPEVYWHLGLLYNADLKKYKEAASAFETYLRLAPNAKNKEQIRTMIDDLKRKASTE